MKDFTSDKKTNPEEIYSFKKGTSSLWTPAALAVQSKWKFILNVVVYVRGVTTVCCRYDNPQRIRFSPAETIKWTDFAPSDTFTKTVWNNDSLCSGLERNQLIVGTDENCSQKKWNLTYSFKQSSTIYIQQYSEHFTLTMGNVIVVIFLPIDLVRFISDYRMVEGEREA